MNEKKIISKLDDVTLNQMYAAGFQALMRLQLYFTGRTHEIMLAFSDNARAAILRKAGRDGVLDATAGYAAQSDMLKLWADAWAEWQAEFQQLRREAVRIAFGVQAVFHQRLIAPLVVTEGQRSVVSGQFIEAVVDDVYDPQLRILLNVAEEYLYGDSLNLSGRIWRIDREARDAINQTILRGVTNGASAWDVARQLEQFLGAGQDCPRWTSTRLYGRTKTEIAGGDPTGLLRGADCNGSGVSYKALRLARTEIQKIHSLATDRLMRQQPWVQSEKINTSPAHGEPDECDDVASGGEKGDGVYPVGTIELPIHPECLCFKTAVLMPQSEFTSQMNDWLKGGTWAEMDQYANDLGVPLDSDFAPATLSLAVWLFSDELTEFLQ